jgi:adenylate cyclase
VVLGYYLTSDRDGHTSGVLPAPVMDKSKHCRAGRSSSPPGTVWLQHRADRQSRADCRVFQSDTRGRRCRPLLAADRRLQGQYYESLSLAMFRLLAGLPTVSPGFPKERMLARSYQGLESIQLKLATRRWRYRWTSGGRAGAVSRPAGP